MSEDVRTGSRTLIGQLSRRANDVAGPRAGGGRASRFAAARRFKHALGLSRHLFALFAGAALGLAAASAACAQNTAPPEVAVSKGKPPSAATAELTPACRAAKRYIELAVAGRFEDIGDLFANKVDYVGPDAIPLSRQQDIKKGYIALQAAQLSKAGKPRPRIERLVPLNDNECFMEFSNFDYASGAYRLFAIDHFIVGPDGKVVWFRPFFQENSSHWHDDAAAAAGR